MGMWGEQGAKRPGHTDIIYGHIRWRSTYAIHMWGWRG